MDNDLHKKKPQKTDVSAESFVINKLRLTNELKVWSLHKNNQLTLLKRHHVKVGQKCPFEVDDDVIKISTINYFKFLD